MPRPLRRRSTRFAPALAAALLFGLPLQRAAAQAASPATGNTVATIRPGMTEAAVRAAWGTPVTQRSRGQHTYLFYENGCLRTCGTYDVVILEGGQVVDAIVRGSGHRYDGVSSSPPDRAPGFTQPTTDPSAGPKGGPR
ncbi:MAG TPA: hypothetical protein VFS33_10725 [Gemmatimonadales bacterium]|nr:hypothetical protein [Gemmatimonadales bacterium]